MSSPNPEIQVAPLPGDGIGRGVTAAAVRVLAALAPNRRLSFEFTGQPVGAGGIDFVIKNLPSS